MILHADGNSFYASCEKIYRPDLRGKPVAVLSNNDGVIVSLTQEAKALGLKRGDPFYKVEAFCKEKGVTVFSSNYTLYADISRRITTIYMEYAPEIEEYSIDESFLFFPDCNWSKEDYYQVGKELKERVYREVGIPICAGIAPSKTLAKLYNKKAKEHGGVFVYSPEEIDGLLAKTGCGEIWGIGRKREEKLKREGITTALQLKNLPLDRAKKLLTIQGFATVQELNGIPSVDRIIRTQNESLTTSRQFSRQIYDLETIECALTQYTELAVEKLINQKCLTETVQVYLSTCNYAYETNPDKCYSNSAAVRLEKPTCFTPDILKAALFCLELIYRKGYGYKTVMITLMDISRDSGQGLLWGQSEKEEKKSRLMKAVDNLTHNYDRNVLTIARSLVSTGWENKRKRLSPCWTTSIKDCPKVK